MLLVDLSGFTHLLYQASRDPKLTRRILRGVQGLFDRTAEAKESLEGFQVINTTGDGEFLKSDFQCVKTDDRRQHAVLAPAIRPGIGAISGAKETLRARPEDSRRRFPQPS